MGDTMLLGVLRMPMDDPDPVRLMQFVGRARQAADRIEADAKEIARLQKDAERLQKENERWRTTGQNLLEQMLDEIRRGDRFAEALEEIASLPDARSDEAALIARKALA